MHAWFDTSAGVAGDMLLGALLDAGADAAGVRSAVDAVVPGAVRIEVTAVTRNGQRASRAGVRLLRADEPHRAWRQVQDMLLGAPLAEPTRTAALRAFTVLAEAEARAHGIDPDDVVFHEVGSLDAIADVVGTCEALRLLGVTSASAGPVALGSGRVRAAHGDIGVPVPAVAELARGWQVTSGVLSAPDAHPHHPHPHEHARAHAHHEQEDPGAAAHGSAAPDPDGLGREEGPAEILTPGEVGELATPTGMALIRALARRCEPIPPLTVSTIGVGAGGRDIPGRPNVVRVVIGEPLTARRPVTELVEVMANVDDLDPRVWPAVLDAVLRAGAVDAWLVPIHMKKGRPGFTLHALVNDGQRDVVSHTILEHTTTLGVREVGVLRTVLDRAWVTVRVAGQPLEVKVGSREGMIVHAAAEFESLAALASSLGRPQAEAAQRAAAAIVAAGLVPGAPAPGGAD